MKYVKFLAVALASLLTLVSCESGSVGQTIVQFADQQYEGGFGSGWIYVPLTLSGTEMNTKDVEVSVKVVPVDSEYTEAVEDKDYQITSYDLVFRPGVEEVALEIELMETDPMKLPDIMEFKLEIVASNTNVGANHQCLVHLEKTTADRLCGEWYLSFEAYPNYGDIMSPMRVNVTWNDATNSFSMLALNNPSSVYGTYPLTMVFDQAKDYIILPAYHFIEWYQGGDQIILAQFQATNVREAVADDGSLMMICDRSGDDIIGTYDKENFQTITFPASDTAMAIGYTFVDESGNPTYFSFFGTGMRNVKLTRTRPQ